MNFDEFEALPYICGMTWGYGAKRGTWGTVEAMDSLTKLCEMTGVNTVVLVVPIYQEKAQSVVIDRNSELTVRDDEVLKIAAWVHSKGLKVILKPIIDVLDGTWRAHINFFDIDVPSEPKWSEWFESYAQNILHYAEIASQAGCFMFCIGCELVQAQRRELEWRMLIDRLRKAYGGLLTFNADKYQEGEVRWWDAVDVISSSGYYPVTEWQIQMKRIEKTVTRFHKPFFFIEAGCPSRKGSLMVPNKWDLIGKVCLEEQRDYYDVMFNEVSNYTWFRGFGLWDWPVKLYSLEEAQGDDGYCIYGKPASSVVLNDYRRFNSRAGSDLC